MQSHAPTDWGRPSKSRPFVSLVLLFLLASLKPPDCFQDVSQSFIPQQVRHEEKSNMTNYTLGSQRCFYLLSFSAFNELTNLLQPWRCGLAPAHQHVVPLYRHIIPRVNDRRDNLEASVVTLEPLGNCRNKRLTPQSHTYGWRSKPSCSHSWYSCMSFLQKYQTFWMSLGFDLSAYGCIRKKNAPKNQMIHRVYSST